MILVTLGTQDKDFTRLVKYVEDLVIDGTIKDDVYVQLGHTKYSSDVIKTFSLKPVDELNELIKNAKYIITHGGVGSILTPLKYNKKVIAVPRREKYHEHTNDHQLEIVEEFSNLGYIKSAYDLESLKEAIKTISKFKPKKYESNTNNLVNLISDYIDNL